MAERPEAWSDEENLLIVADYFDMLALEVRGEPYNKSARNEALRKLLRDRSHGSVERKHQNISAFLDRAGLRFINGYKPLKNAQQSLQVPIDHHVEAHPEVIGTFERVTSEEPRGLSDATDDREVPKPRPLRPGTVRSPSLLARGLTNYAELDEKNRRLGLQGEEWVLDGEFRRLTDRGRKDLAKQVVHVSKEEGSAPGYDIRSFNLSGTQRLIEVKTTNHGARLPFVITRNEVNASSRLAAAYHLYRVFAFSRDPRYFILSGPVREACILEPKTFIARVG